ncbi:MAG: hypothetical protein JWL90_1597, partial [Chthoniobacteraceae bacterium]|nr:hypothetical protein [Chthoniobacteraceae bacterium]
MKLSHLTVFSLLSLYITANLPACDLCGCYLPPQEFVHERPFAIYAGMSEQFTHFGTLQFNDHEIANPSGQYLDSSITQFLIGSSFFDNRLALQANVPLIYRSYKRPEGFEIDRGNESGLGDISLLANLIVFRKDALFHESGQGLSKDGKTAAVPLRGEPDFSATINLIAGIKLPTGDSSRLKEEF